MVVKSFTFNPFQTNCYVCHDGGEAALIDPACSTAEERRAVLAYAEQHGLTFRHLLLTHAHIDHIFGCAFFEERLGQSFRMHRDDLLFMQHAQEQARLFGIALEDPPLPSAFLKAGDVVEVGEARWTVLHTPGHSPGSISFYDEANAFVIAGDVLFQGSIGRTDLWRGSLPELMQSIHTQLLPLGDDVTVYAGHGPATTIGAERRHNPFLTDAPVRKS